MLMLTMMIKGEETERRAEKRKAQKAAIASTLCDKTQHHTILLIFSISSFSFALCWLEKTEKKQKGERERERETDTERYTERERGFIRFIQ